MWSFEPTAKAPGSRTRAVPVGETERRAREVRRLVPISRVADLTPLDALGLPVYAAATPLALDLTTHLGKGLDRESARVSAILEAVERVSAEAVEPGRVVRASFDQLASRPDPEPVDPREFELPPGTAFRTDRPFGWVEGFDLLARVAVRIPVDLAISPPVEGILHEVDTNGLASGNLVLEAVVHAICEVVERDVLAQHEFAALYASGEDAPPPARPVDPATLPHAAREWVDRTRAGGLEVAVDDLTGDLGVATFRTTVLDPGYPSPEGPMAAIFPGFGTHPDAEVAVARSVTEAIQSRLAAIQGARDSYNLFGPGLRWATRTARLRPLTPARRHGFDETPTFRSDDLLDDLEFLLARLADAGVERVVAVDLSRPDLGFPVVRVRAAGLASFAVNQRRLGWRCRRHVL